MEKLKKHFGAREAHESNESPELFRASLGFDFVFTHDPQGALRCYCVEVNGHDSGVLGVEDIPEGQIDAQHKMLAGIRATEHPEMSRKRRLYRKIADDMDSGLFTPSPEGQERIDSYLKKSLDSQPFFKHAYHNPDFIERITQDKRRQELYIPQEYQPRAWHEGDDPASSTGAWVIKHHASRTGNNVHVVPNNIFADVLAGLKEKIKNFAVQEYISSAGAQMMPDSVGRRAASMRLLMDFRCREDGTIVPDFVTAYQRVAPYDKKQARDEQGQELTPADRLVVNRARGAESTAVSSEEMKLACEAAEKIIRNLAEGYQQDKDGQSSLESFTQAEPDIIENI